MKAYQASSSNKPTGPVRRADDKQEDEEYEESDFHQECHGEGRKRVSGHGQSSSVIMILQKKKSRKVKGTDRHRFMAVLSPPQYYSVVSGSMLWS